MRLFSKILNLFKFKSDSIVNGNFDGIIAAKVLEVQKHPNADRLRIVKVDVGDRIIEPIVCGAFNFEIGDMVALALPGAKIAQNIHTGDRQGFVLEKAKIRGIESQGMICAAFELGLSDVPEQPARRSLGEGGGIMVLKSDVKPGSLFKPEMLR